jgi:hypothetical protein
MHCGPEVASERKKIFLFKEFTALRNTLPERSQSQGKKRQKSFYVHVSRSDLRQSPKAAF